MTRKVGGQPKHGLANRGKKTYLYFIWVAMRARCNNPRDKGYKNYGGRGICVSKDWDDFRVFVKDMGERPTRFHTIERKDNNGNYCKSNCKWATHIEQSMNKRSTRLSPEKVRAIRKSHKGYGDASRIAREIGVSRSAVDKVIKRRTWSHVV